jgi:hypothetical protein
MKKIIVICICLIFSVVAKSQNDCLATQCTATKAHAGDTAQIGAIFTANAGVSLITFTFVSGPNTPMISAVNNSFLSGVVDTGRVAVTNLIAGTYVIKVVGTDKSGGITAPQYDSIVVAAVTPCPACPAARTVVSWTVIQVNGMGRIQVSFSDGSIQTLP